MPGRIACTCRIKPFSYIKMCSLDIRDLIVYYTFDGYEDPTVIDCSPMKNNGKIYGNYRFANGKYGMALKFESGTYIDLNGPKFLGKSDEAITICVWLNHKSSSDNQEIFDVIGTSHSDGLYHFEIRPDNTFRWYARNDNKTTIFDIDHKGDATPNKWIHVAGTYSRADGKAILYFNAEKIAESSGNLVLPTDWGTAARIGQHRGGRWFIGLMDDFNIWRKALTQEEIKMVMDGNLTK